MSINRRNFFKVLGVTGVSLTTGTALASRPEAGVSETEFYGVLYDSTRCIGCQSCEYACAETHGLPEPTEFPDAAVVRKTDETRRMVINAVSTPDAEIYVKKQCMHCNDPACGAACLTKAILKTEEGPVIWRSRKCMGCRYCMVSCPYDMPKFEYHSANPKIEKCDMCFDRVSEGGIPACVEACPAEALTFGTRRELIAEARKRIHDNPGQYYDHIYGEHEAGGTGYLYISPVPFEQLGFDTSLQKSSYPALTKEFLYAVPAVFVLWPAMLLGLQQATKNNNQNDHQDE